jgi:hypothetical protein
MIALPHGTPGGFLRTTLGSEGWRGFPLAGALLALRLGAFRMSYHVDAAKPGDNGGSACGSPVMRLPRACDSRKVTGRVSGIATTGEQDSDLRLLLSKLFRRYRLPKGRADRSLRARQRDHSDAHSAALGTWQHASADNLKDSFACRCYGCTGAGRLFAGKSSRGGFLSPRSVNA